MAADALVTKWTIDGASTYPPLDALRLAAAVASQNLNSVLEREVRPDTTRAWMGAFLTRAQAHIRRVVMRHVASSRAVSWALTTMFQSRAEVLASTDTRNEAVELVRTFFDPGAPATTLGCDLLVGMVVFEGRMQSHVVDESGEFERHRATSTSLSASSALRFASWHDADGVEDQRAALAARSDTAPLLYVHKIASAGVMGVMVHPCMIVYNQEMSGAVMQEKEVLLAPFSGVRRDQGGVATASQPRRPAPLPRDLHTRHATGRGVRRLRTARRGRRAHGRIKITHAHTHIHTHTHTPTHTHTHIQTVIVVMSSSSSSSSSSSHIPPYLPCTPEEAQRLAAHVKLVSLVQATRVHTPLTPDDLRRRHEQEVTSKLVPFNRYYAATLDSRHEPPLMMRSQSEPN